MERPIKISITARPTRTVAAALACARLQAEREGEPLGKVVMDGVVASMLPADPMLRSAAEVAMDEGAGYPVAKALESLFRDNGSCVNMQAHTDCLAPVASLAAIQAQGVTMDLKSYRVRQLADDLDVLRQIVTKGDPALSSSEQDLGRLVLAANAAWHGNLSKAFDLNPAAVFEAVLSYWDALSRWTWAYRVMADTVALSQGWPNGGDAALDLVGALRRSEAERSPVLNRFVPVPESMEILNAGTVDDPQHLWDVRIVLDAPDYDQEQGGLSYGYLSNRSDLYEAALESGHFLSREDRLACEGEINELFRMATAAAQDSGRLEPGVTYRPSARLFEDGPGASSVAGPPFSVPKEG